MPAGRPRSENYEKNLKYRKDVNPKHSELVKAEAYALAKSIMATTNINRLMEKNNQPVYSDSELEWQADGVILRPPWRIPFRDLRTASYTTSLIGAIHKIDVDLTTPYFYPRNKKTDEQGYGFMILDEDETPSEEQTQLIKRACNFFKLMGEKCEGWSKRDHIKPVGEMMTRDTLTIDQVCFWLRRNSFDKLIEIKYLDPATIFECDERIGYRGDKSIGYVQIVNDNIVTLFRHDEIILRRKHFSSDVTRRLTGFSPTEACLSDFVGFLNAIKFNKDRFVNPKPLGFLSIPADVSQDTIEDLQIQFDAVYNGNMNYYKMPIIATSAGEIKYNSLNLPSDMLFDKLIQWLSSLVLAAHGVSQEELGIKLMASQSISEPSQNEKVKHSSSRRLKSHLGFFADCFNLLKENCSEFDTVSFTFYGTEEKDIDGELNRDEKKSKSIQFIDEIRAKRDLPTLGEEMIKRYNLTGEKAEKVKLIGAYISDQSFIQMNSQLIGELTGASPEGQPQIGENDQGSNPPSFGQADNEMSDEDFFSPQEEEPDLDGLSGDMNPNDDNENGQGK